MGGGGGVLAGGGREGSGKVCFVSLPFVGVVRKKIRCARNVVCEMHSLLLVVGGIFLSPWGSHGKKTRVWVLCFVVCWKIYYYFKNRIVQAINYGYTRLLLFSYTYYCALCWLPFVLFFLVIIIFVRGMSRQGCCILVCSTYYT